MGVAQSGIYAPDGGEQRCEHCAGIVSGADLMLGSAVEPLIQAQIAAARNFRGIRFRGGGADSIDFEDPSFREGVAVLAKHGLVLDCNGPEVRPGRR